MANYFDSVENGIAGLTTAVNCGTCIYSFESQDAGNKATLECRRYPPTWALTPKGPSGPPLIGAQPPVVIMKQSAWPTVGVDQRCGEWVTDFGLEE
jgi:hypothetical protein